MRKDAPARRSRPAATPALWPRRSVSRIAPGAPAVTRHWTDARVVGDWACAAGAAAAITTAATAGAASMRALWDMGLLQRLGTRTCWVAKRLVCGAAWWPRLSVPRLSDSQRITRNGRHVVRDRAGMDTLDAALWSFPAAYALHVAQEAPGFTAWARRYVAPRYTQ